MLQPYLITLTAMTIITIIAYSYDFAVSTGQWQHDHRPRIPEYILMALAAFGGALGAWITVKVQRHKSSGRKKHFHYVIRMGLIMNLITIIAMLTSELIGG